MKMNFKLIVCLNRFKELKKIDKMNRRTKYFYQLKVNIDSFCGCSACQLGSASFKIFPEYSCALCESVDFYKKTIRFSKWDLQVDCRCGVHSPMEIDPE